MKPKTTLSRMEEIILQEKRVTPKQLIQQLNVSQVLVHRHLKKLCHEGKIVKHGSAPRVFYVPAPSREAYPQSISSVIEQNWVEILPDGRFLYGNSGFSHWCHQRNFDPLHKQKEYELMHAQNQQYKENGLINATEKITKSFQNNYLEQVWYIDFYSWKVFGKTLLGKLVLHAKQNSDIALMKEVAARVKIPFQYLVQKEKFDLLGIIPHSVPRKKDFLSTTLSFLPLFPAPERIFEKFFWDHAVAQKTLKSKKEREQNAEKTLFLKKEVFPKKILLIDDACGSGATLNIAAQKISSVSPKTKVYGITFVGSLKGFEVISES